MWMRWVLSLGVAALLVVALVRFVSHHNGNGLARQNPKATARANEEAEIVVRQDQAPHVVALPAAAARPEVARAIRRDMAARIAAGNATAPLQGVRCRTGPSQGTKAAFHCRATAAGVGYPYEAVLDRSAHTLTFCKHDAPPVPAMNIPVSPRCRL